MKINIAAVFFAALAGMSGSHYALAEASALTVNGGTVHFVGSLTDGPCAVRASLGERIVGLDQVEVSKLATPGEAAGQVRLFHVVLDDCNITVYTNVSVSFSGKTDPIFTSVLVNQATDEPAEHVGLQLYDETGNKIVPNATGDMKLTTGINVMPLTVDYVPTGLKPKAGNVTSVVTFNVNYS
jgi:type 1 fimbria pilin